MTDIYRCTPRQVRAFTKDILFAGLVPFVQSSPGMGKSSIMASLADELNVKLIDHRLSTSAPEDLSGLPEFYDTAAGRRARFVPFGDLFPIAGDPLPTRLLKRSTDGGPDVTQPYDGWMLFLDEFNSAAKSVQAAAYKLILDKMVGQFRLHEKVVISAAGNLSTDRAFTNALSTAMQSRVVHLEMQINYEEWLYDVALKQDYDSRIVAYLSQYEGKLMDFNPAHAEKTFCCPRTWEFVNRLIKGNPVSADTAPLLAGVITSGTAVDFVQFCQIYTNLVTVDQILKDPENCPVPGNPNLRWATITHMMEKVTDTNFKDLSTYADRFDISFRILFYRSCLVRHAHLRNHPSFVPAMAALSRYLHA